MIDLDLSERVAITRGLASAVRHDGLLTATQSSLLTAVAGALLDVQTPIEHLAPITPVELADAISAHETRVRAVHGMVALEIVAQPVTPAVHGQVTAFAAALGVDEAMLAVAQDYANNAMEQATQDFLRNSYIAEYYGRQDPAAASPALHKRTDPALAAKWQALEICPSGSHGRMVWEFYQMRGFAFPGTEGAVDPLLAQHDWVHCLADYGTSATGEIEVFTFLGSAIPDPKGFSYCVVILGLFETGYVPFVPGVATARPGHLSQPGAAIRMADALRRGIRLNVDVMGGVDCSRPPHCRSKRSERGSGSSRRALQPLLPDPCQRWIPPRCSASTPSPLAGTWRDVLSSSVGAASWGRDRGPQPEGNQRAHVTSEYRANSPPGTLDLRAWRRVRSVLLQVVDLSPSASDLRPCSQIGARGTVGAHGAQRHRAAVRSHESCSLMG